MTTMTDGQGQAVPLQYVSKYDRERDKLARKVLARWEKLRAAVCKCHAETFRDVETMERLAAEGRPDRRLGVRGNFQFSSFDGLIQISRNARYDLRFDERFRAAKLLIDEIVREKTEVVDADTRELIKGIFQTTADGLLSKSRVLSLFRLRIKHPQWLTAMDLIKASIESVRGRDVLSVRKKVSRQADWESVLLDGSSASESVASSETT